MKKIEANTSPYRVIVARYASIENNPPPEFSPLSPEQIRGLNEIGFGFRTIIEPKSLRQQQAEDKNGYFGYVNNSKILSVIVPRWTEVAINPHLNEVSPALPESNNLSLDNQLQLVHDFDHSIRKQRITGTLKGVEFVIEEAPTITQIDHDYEQQTGDLLLTDMFARSISPTYQDGSCVADVGRGSGDRRLSVSAWGRGAGYPGVWVVPVARPMKK